MYFFYLVVNRAGVCTSNSSKIDINCTSRHWALTLCPEVSLVSSRHTRAGGHAGAQSALLSSPPARALEGRAGRKRRRREGRWGLLSLPRAHAGPPRAWAMEGGARTMGSHRAAQLGGASRCYFPGRGGQAFLLQPLRARRAPELPSRGPAPPRLHFAPPLAVVHAPRPSDLS